MKKDLLCDKSSNYLDSLDGPLAELERQGLLNEKVISAVVCSIMYSLASIEVDHDTVKVRNNNLSITAFIQAVRAINVIHRVTEFDKNTFYESWLFYNQVMRENEIQVEGAEEFKAKWSMLEESISVPQQVTPLSSLD